MKCSYLEDFHVGDMYITTPWIITQADASKFYAGRGKYNSLRAGAEFVGTQIDSGMFGASIALELWNRFGLVDESAVTLLEMEWKFVRPIFIGDTISGEIEISDIETVSKPRHERVHVNLNVVKQMNQVVQQAVLVLMAKSRL